MKPRALFSALGAPRGGDSPPVRGRWLIFISILLAIFFLYLALRGLDWRVFFDALKHARYAYLSALFLWSSFTFLLRAFRLQILLSGEKKLRLSTIFWANMAGYLGNNVLPARAGELIRAAYLSRGNDLNVSYVLAIGLTERLMDAIALIAVSALALSFDKTSAPTLQSALKAISTFGLGGLFAVFFLPYFERQIERLIMGLPLLPALQKDKLNRFFRQFMDGLRSFRSLLRIFQFICLTILIWLIDAVGMVFLAYILNLRLLLFQAFIFLAALGLSSAIPSTPGYVGVYQFVAVTVLAPFGFSKAEALAFILVSQIMGYLVVGLWGTLSLWRYTEKDAR